MIRVFWENVESVRVWVSIPKQDVVSLGEPLVVINLRLTIINSFWEKPKSSFETKISAMPSYADLLKLPVEQIPFTKKTFISFGDHYSGSFSFSETWLTLCCGKFIEVVFHPIIFEIVLKKIFFFFYSEKKQGKKKMISVFRFLI